MKLLNFTAITNSPYEDHRLLSAMFPNARDYLFVNNFGNYTALVSADKIPQETEFTKKLELNIRDSENFIFPKQDETVSFVVKFCTQSKSPKRHPESYKSAKGKFDKNGFCLGNANEAKQWLWYVINKNGANLNEIDIAIDKTECWAGKDQQKIIVHSASVICKITDEKLFANLVKKGIGDSKYLGLGLAIQI